MLGKTVTIMVEVVTDPEETSLSKQDFALVVVFAEAAPEFNLDGFTIPVLPCDERAATWSMKMPPIRFPELQKVTISESNNDLKLFEYNESQQVVYLSESKRKSIINGSFCPS